MNELDRKILELIKKDNSELLDPFHIVFPLPGMWHFAFGSILALIAFAGSYSLFFFSTSANFFVVLGSMQLFALVGVILIILCSRGFLFPAKLILLYAVMSLVFLGARFYYDLSMGIVELALFILSLIALYLLTHRMSRTLLIIFFVRFRKIREMKKDGTYIQKRAEARAKYKMK